MNGSAPDSLVLPPDSPEAFTHRLSGIRRHLHMHPEVGGREAETARFLHAALAANELQPHGPLAGTGLYVDIQGRRPGRRVGYRADIDALPIQDAKDTPYASRYAGVAHLCGHDAHTSIALATAVLLHHRRDRFGGTIRVFFQPNEEGTPSGAPEMIRDGVLDSLEAVYAIHVDPSLPSGTFGLIAGPATAATDLFRVVVATGLTGHSARPHETPDTVWVATQIAQSYYQLVGRVTDARNPAVLTICRFHGGDAYNVIPAEVEFGGTLRTTDPGDRAYLQDLLGRIASETGARYRTPCHVEVVQGAPAVVNDARLVTLAEATITELFGKTAAVRLPRPSMGGEDFAHYLQHLPGVLLRVGTSAGPETSYPLHHARFDLDEGALLPAARLLASLLIRHLEENPLAT